MNFTVAGTVPKHIALSSSGAIEVAAAVALRRYYKSKLTDMQLVASLAQAKKEFFGEETSIVEYMVHFFSKKDTFLVIDENTLDMRFVKSPVSKYHLLITDSNVSMIGVDDDIESRRDDIDEAVKLLSKQYFQRQSTPSARRVQTLPEPAPLLRDFIGGGMEEALRDLDDDVRRHCIHAMKEVEAVKNAEKALRDQDVSSFAKTIYHSHESLRDYYEVSCPEIDWLVKRAQETPGVLTSRMTGRGFGGCTYTFLEPEAEQTYQEHRDDYERIFGFHPNFMTFKVGTGARVIHDE
jgi:galactokinase